MISIAVCDDEKIYSDLIANNVIKAFQNKGIEVNVKNYVNSRMLEKDLDVLTFDLVFLDIDMPNFTGFDIAKSIQIKTNKTQIIFISAKNELVYESFNYRPFYFIRKNDFKILQTNLEEVIEKYLGLIKQHCIIEINDLCYGKTMLCIEDILYISSKGHYIYYHVIGREKPYHTRNSINEIEEEMCYYDFLRTHNRYMVNMNRIKNIVITNNTIQLSNNDVIPISRSFKNSTLNLYAEFRRR